MAQKKKTWKDDPLLKAALAKAEFDDDWAYRVHTRREELLPLVGKSNIREQYGEFDPSAPPESRWLARNEAGEVIQSGRFAGERSTEYSVIKHYLRYGPALVLTGDDGSRCTYHGKQDARSLTLVIEKDHPHGPFVCELREVEEGKELNYRFTSDWETGTGLVTHFACIRRMSLGAMLLGEHRQLFRFEDYRYTGPSVDEPEPPAQPMQWEDPMLNEAMAKLRGFDHQRWGYRGRVRGWNAANGEVFADATFRYDSSIINDEDDQPDPIQDVVDATGHSDEVLPWEEGSLWDYGTIEWTVGQDIKKVRSGPGYAAYRYGPYTDASASNADRYGSLIVRTIGPHAPYLCSLKQFERRGSTLSMEHSKFTVDAETGDPLLRQTLVFDDTGEPDYTHYRLNEAWDYSRVAENPNEASR